MARAGKPVARLVAYEPRSPDRLDARARDAVRDGRKEVLASAASIREIAIKRAADKLRAPDGLLDVIAASGFGTLAITAGHATLAGALPPIYRDPFDRMLVAQASVDSLTIVTRDQRLAAYGVDVLEAGAAVG